jgi:hypothetical protein
MHKDSTLAHSRSVEAPYLRGTVAHHNYCDAIRAAETAQMLSSSMMMVNLGFLAIRKSCPILSTAGIVLERFFLPIFLGIL